MAQEQLPVCHNDSEVNIPRVLVVNGARYIVGEKLCCRGGPPVVKKLGNPQLVVRQ
jgi:hypothetical protein